MTARATARIVPLRAPASRTRNPAVGDRCRIGERSQPQAKPLRGRRDDPARRLLDPSASRRAVGSAVDSWGRARRGRVRRQSRVSRVLAPATEICWPTMARTAISKPSTERGTRTPGCAATGAASAGSAASTRRWPPDRRPGRAAGGSGRPPEPGPAGPRGAGWRPRGPARGQRTSAGPYGSRNARGSPRSPPPPPESRAAPGSPASRGVQRRPVGEPNGDRPTADRRPWSRGGPQLGRRDPVDLADGVVELADRAEPGRERDLGQPQVGRLDQGTSGLRPLGPRQC